MANAGGTLSVRSAVLTRLSKLATLTPAETDSLLAAERDGRRLSARRDLVEEGQPLREARALLSGWACRQRILPDGRRQILSFVLPGDLVGLRRHADEVATSTIMAVTDLVTCPLPTPQRGSSLEEAYGHSLAMDDQHHLAQIVRLGRLNAPERIADWLLETQDRLTLAGLSDADRFPLPLTQEMLADALGLTSVHVNRTLQSMRRDGLLTFRAGMISLPERSRLEHLAGYKAPHPGGRR